MKNFKIFLLFAFILLLFSSCVHVIDIEKCVSGTTEYGFLGGLWHGITAGIRFIGSLFNHDIAVYAVHNNGGWYNFGYLLGVGSALGSSRTTYVRTKKRKY